MGFGRDYLLDILLMSMQFILSTVMISGWNNHDRREREKKEPESTILNFISRGGFDRFSRERYEQ